MTQHIQEFQPSPQQRRAWSLASDAKANHSPPVVLRFHLADQLHVEAVAAIEIDGIACEPGTIEMLRPGAVVCYAGGRFEVISGRPLSPDARESPPDSRRDEPSEVYLEFLPRGGRLTIRHGEIQRSVYLPERRCDLVAALLKPPSSFAPGDFIPDEVTLPRIWPSRTMSRVDLNVLIHRARHDLGRAEINGAAILDRADGGNATRFRLARDAQVTVD